MGYQGSKPGQLYPTFCTIFPDPHSPLSLSSHDPNSREAQSLFTLQFFLPMEGINSPIISIGSLDQVSWVLT